MNHFEFFGLDISFDLDIASIKKKYLSLQQAFHPDKAKNDIEKIEYLEKSMRLNEAYKILLNDYLRAIYLLEILGIAITEENSRNALSTRQLESIWEDNEKLEEIGNLEELYRFEKDKLIDQNGAIARLSKAFKELLPEEGIVSNISSKNAETTIALTVKLKYLTNLVRNIRNKIKTLPSLF